MHVEQFAESHIFAVPHSLWKLWKCQKHPRVHTQLRWRTTNVALRASCEYVFVVVREKKNCAKCSCPFTVNKVCARVFLAWTRSFVSFCSVRADSCRAGKAFVLGGRAAAVTAESDFTSLFFRNLGKCKPKRIQRNKISLSLSAISLKRTLARVDWRGLLVLLSSQVMRPTWMRKSTHGLLTKVSPLKDSHVLPSGQLFEGERSCALLWKKWWDYQRWQLVDCLSCVFPKRIRQNRSNKTAWYCIRSEQCHVTAPVSSRCVGAVGVQRFRGSTILWWSLSNLTDEQAELLLIKTKLLPFPSLFHHDAGKRLTLVHESFICPVILDTPRRQVSSPCTYVPLDNTYSSSRRCEHTFLPAVLHPSTYEIRKSKLSMHPCDN